MKLRSRRIRMEIEIRGLVRAFGKALRRDVT
jgi:hypothetical protein